jgi:hypothetical protein
LLQFLSKTSSLPTNALKKTYPESWSPIVSCHILRWIEVYIFQNKKMPGAGYVLDPVLAGKIQYSFLACGGGGLERERQREVLAVQGLNPRQRGDGTGNYRHLCGCSSQRPPAVELRALSSPYNAFGMEHSDWSKYVEYCLILQ